MDAAARYARAEAARLADEAGAADAEIAVTEVVNTATVEGEELFVDATVTARHRAGRAWPAYHCVHDQRVHDRCGRGGQGCQSVWLH